MVRPERRGVLAGASPVRVATHLDMVDAVAPRLRAYYNHILDKNDVDANAVSIVPLICKSWKLNDTAENASLQQRS
jgi:hypothetical protein